MSVAEICAQHVHPMGPCMSFMVSIFFP
jgi:hypothetical protein